MDTDHDGMPDWAEFDLASNTNHPDHNQGDPFNADVDGDGKDDGWTTDSDQDGIFDAFDIAPNDEGVDWTRGPSPRYALFDLLGCPDPTTDAGRAIHVTDQGYVLFPYGVWFDGAYEELTLDATGLTGGKAFAMGPTGKVIGSALFDYDEDDTPEKGVMAYWANVDAAPQVIEKESGNNLEVAAPGYDLTYGFVDRGTMLDAEGNFFAYSNSLEWQPADPGANPPKPYASTEMGRVRWTLPGPGNAGVESSAAPPHAANLIDLDTFWGPDDTRGWKLLFSLGDEDFPASSVHPRIIKTPGWGYLAAGINFSESLGSGGFSPSVSLKNAIDMSSQGWAIMSDAKIWTNGFSLPLSRAIPEIGGDWAGFVDLHDISPMGNVLLSYDDGSGHGLRGGYGLAVPFYLEDVEIETGVDSVSVTVENPGPGVRDRHWIMAPAGGENTVFVRSTACSTCSLKLTAGGGTTVLPREIEQDRAMITVSAPAGATTADHDLTIGLGGKNSSTFPIGVKVMKKRDVRVIVHKIASLTKDTNGNDVRIIPDLPLSREQIQESLNKVYSPQTNTTFTVEMNPPTEGEYIDITWDVGEPSDYDGPGSNLFAAHDQRLQVTGGDVLSFEAKKINSALKSDSHPINIYMIGCKIISVIEIKGALYHGASAFGIGYPDPLNVVFANAHAWAPDRAAEMKNTLAHEIGHLLFGPGHPDQGDGAAPLKGTNYQDRLMVSGKRTRRPNFGYLVVKREWDRAEGWLGRNVDGLD